MFSLWSQQEVKFCNKTFSEGCTVLFLFWKKKKSETILNICYLKSHFKMAVNKSLRNVLKKRMNRECLHYCHYNSFVQKVRCSYYFLNMDFAWSCTLDPTTICHFAYAVCVFVKSPSKQTNLSWPSLLSHSLDLVQYSVGTPAKVSFVWGQ